MGGSQSTQPGNYQGPRLNDERTWFDSTQVIVKGSPDPNCLPNDDPHKMWGWGQKLVSAGPASMRSAVEVYKRNSYAASGLWWGFLAGALILLGTGIVTFVFAGNARPDFPVEGEVFANYTFSIQYIFAALPILAAIWLSIPVFRGTDFIAQVMIVHTGGWMIYAPSATLVLAEALLTNLLVGIRTSFVLWALSIAFVLVVILYFIKNEQIAEQQTWKPQTLGLWVIATVTNLALWFYIGGLLNANFSSFKMWEQVIVSLFIIFGAGRWLNLSLYVFGRSLPVPNYPDAFYVYTSVSYAIYMVEFLVIAWIYIACELF
ncbi:MAG: hypothetical protein CMP20_04555 [Rickettsiales bacterium]|nr:hypothetical protein [Rickettsiales bacterium]